MLNKEKYAKEILDIVCKAGHSPAVVNNKPVECNNTECKDCNFYVYGSCSEKFIEWANSEYKEPEIDWTKVPVDTPVYVWDHKCKSRLKRHFAGYDKDNNKIIVFLDGRTSWSVNVVENTTKAAKWDYAEIAEGVDCSEWYKD
jgi:hypothetical protein